MRLSLLECTLRLGRCAGTPYCRYSATFQTTTGDLVRVRVCVDGPSGQSFAVAEALDESLTWTALLSEPPTLLAGTSSSGNVAGAAERFARDLAARAVTAPISVRSAA